MTDPNGTQPAAAEPPAAAPETPQTDEQIWEELTRDDSAAPDPNDKPIGDPDAPPGWNEADDDAGEPQTTSQPDAATTAPADDPWAKAPPELLKDRERMEHMIRSLNGRVRALTKRHVERKNPSADETKALAETTKALADKAGEYPDILGPVVETIKTLETRIARFDEAGEKEREDLVAEEWNTFTALHADGMKVIEENAKAFEDWLKVQPKDVRDIIDANKDAVIDGAGAAMVVSAFKEHVAAAQKPPAPSSTTPNPDPRRDLQLRGANATTSRSAPVTSDPSLADMTPEQLWEYWDKEDQKKQARR